MLTVGDFQMWLEENKILNTAPLIIISLSFDNSTGFELTLNRDGEVLLQEA